MKGPSASSGQRRLRWPRILGSCARGLGLIRGDPARLAVQTVLAVLVTYAAALWLHLPEPSWAVFSALFVIQGSIGGTLTAAMDRVQGAVLGALLALLCVSVIGTGAWRTILSLVTGVGIMSLIAGVRPQLNYGLVPVAVLTVAPGTELVEDGLLKIAAIGLGAAAGALASVLVLPRQAHRAAEQHLVQALAGCGALLSACMDKLLSQDERDLHPLHARIARELALAGSMSRQTRLRRKQEQYVLLSSLLNQVERLWYTLAMADRLSARPLPDAVREAMAAPVRQAAGEAERFLYEAGQALTCGKPPPAASRFDALAQEVGRLVERLRAEGQLSQAKREEAEQILGLSLAWQQLSRNVEDLLALASADQAAGAEIPACGR